MIRNLKNMKYLKIFLMLIVLSNIRGLKSQQVTVSGTSPTSTVTLVGARTVVNITAGSAITVSRRSNADTLKNIMYTVVGGGGSGAISATHGGGGGGGVAFSHTSGTNFIGNPTTITVGSGGIAVTGASTNGNSGNNSSLTLTSAITATGGGAGNGTVSTSGGGGITALTGGSGTPTGTTGGAANAGGANAVKSGTYDGGGGGGGSGISATGTGGTASSAGKTGVGGNGGNGLTINNLITGSGTIIYGGGGGGGGTTTGGIGGTGGGGAGSTGIATAGSANTGGGGGGGVTTSGSGGSGVVVLSFDAWDIYDDVQTSNKWIYANGTGLGTGSRTLGLPIKIFPNGTNTISVTSTFVNDANADVYIEGAALSIGAGGSIVCRNLYINNGGSINTTSTGSITCNTVFYSGSATLPSTGFNVTNLYCEGTSGSVVQLSSNLSVTNLFIRTGGSLKLAGKNLTITGKIDNTWRSNSGTGVISSDTGAVLTYNGTSASIYMDQTTPGESNALRRLVLGSSANLTLGNALVVYGKRQTSNTEKGAVELGSSSVLNSNSDKSLTAYLQLLYNTIWDEHATISGINKSATTAVLNGEIMYQDYFVSGYRAYRQTGFVTINNIDSTNGMSMIQLTDDMDLYGKKGATGSGGRLNNADALLEPDGTVTKPSIFTYDETRPNSATSSWIPFEFSTSIPNYIKQAQGIFLFMRPKGSGVSGNYNSCLFETEGRIITGGTSSNFNYSLKSATLTATTGFNLLANPYASHLDLDLFFQNNNNVSNGLYKYNKTAKNYVAFSRTGSGNPFNNGSFGNVTVIEPGDAFFVQQTASSPSTVQFSYDYTTDNTYLSSTSFKNRNTGNGLNKLELDSMSNTILGLLVGEIADSTRRDDMTIMSNKNGGDLTFNYLKGDMVNIPNCLDLNSFSDDGTLSTFKTFDNSRNWVVPLVISSCSIGKHFVNFKLNYNKPGEQTIFSLTDNFTNKTLSIADGLTYYFDVTSDPASKGKGRFYLNLNSTANLSNEGDIAEINRVSLTPNPVSSRSSVIVNTGYKVDYLYIFDHCGKRLLKLDNLDSKLTFEVQLSKYSLKPGIYLIGNENVTFQKLVINE